MCKVTKFLLVIPLVLKLLSNFEKRELSPNFLAKKEAAPVNCTPKVLRLTFGGSSVGAASTM